jgi:HEXXH motif-containing protein
VLVPLRSPDGGRVHSATSGWAFGAIAASLPGDGLACAETLLHEFRHVVLGAIINHVPLVDPTVAWTGRAPWRSDPRPAEGLLQGCFAYAGLIDLWRRLRGGDFDERARAALLTWEDPTDQAMADLAKSGALTETGQSFLAAMRQSL